ncbi:MAG: hypothetical protein KJO08_01375, partial [Gammaproteobacteria bacterium]|nr:hypothetical protein [Gammaproteobacteria bacterium]NNJ84283.1 hypothetical protein [Gammaproteobacteria bacterium]
MNTHPWFIGLLLLGGLGATNIAMAQKQAKIQPPASVAVDKKVDERASLMPVPVPNLERLE